METIEDRLIEAVAEKLAGFDQSNKSDEEKEAILSAEQTIKNNPMEFSSLMSRVAKLTSEVLTNHWYKAVATRLAGLEPEGMSEKERRTIDTVQETLRNDKKLMARVLLSAAAMLNSKIEPIIEELEKRRLFDMDDL